MKKYFKYSLDQFKEDAIANGDGIYTIYKDTLSRDSWTSFVVVNGQIESSKVSDCWATRDYYGDGRALGYSVDIAKLQEMYPEYELYIANLAWYTFPNKWKFTDLEDPTNMYAKHGLKYHILDVASTAEDDPVPSWVDRQFN